MQSRPQEITLNGEWEFTYTSQPLGEHGEIAVPAADRFQARMPVPAYWDDHIDRLKAGDLWYETRFNPDYKPIDFSILPRNPAQEGDMASVGLIQYLVGVGWYRRTLEIPSAWAGRTVTLNVGGVALEARVWVNDRLADRHVGHSTPYAVDISPYLLPGAENLIIIAVSNTSRALWGSDTIGYKGFCGGIYRGVSIKAAGPLAISDWHVYPSGDLGGLHWRVETRGERQSNAILKWSIRDPQTGQTVADGAEALNDPVCEWQTETFGLASWSDCDPRLYVIEFQLCGEGEVWDFAAHSFGLRRLTSKGTRLELNGCPVMLRGATESCYFPLTCTPPLDVESYREIIRRQKAIGFNWLRCHSWVPSDEYMQAADELGMLIQVEPPVGYDRNLWLAIIRHTRHHPSVVLFCGGNEETLDDGKIEFLAGLWQDLRRHVPDALFSPMEALPCVEYSFERETPLPGGIVEKPFRHNPVRLKRLREFADVFANYALGKVSYHSRTGDRKELDSMLAIYGRPCLTHEPGIVGSYINLDLEQRYANTRTGTALYASARRNLEKAGLLARAPLYFRNACAWQRILRKHALENIRKCRYMAGYDYLGAIDFQYMRGGYECGIMNEFYELKPGETGADVLKYNGESVLLLDHSNRRNLQAGDRFECAMLASLYGQADLAEGRVQWELLHADTREALLRGEMGVRDVLRGQVSDVGTVTFVVPKLDRPAKVTLSARLSGGNYELTNDWDFWVFPRHAASVLRGFADAGLIAKLGSCYPGLVPGAQGADESAADGVWVVSKLDQKAVRHLEDGGKVLLLGTEPFASLPLRFQNALSGRAAGNSATVLSDHPILRDFPHDGFCDWQFYSLFDEALTVYFDRDDVPFDPIIDVASTYKRVYKQSALFELKVGKGILIVCTLNINLDDPATALLLDRCLARLAAPESGEPKTNLAPGVLYALLGVQHVEVAEFTTDQAYDKQLRERSRG